MALSESSLRASLLGLYNSMKETPMPEEEFASRMARIINNHILTATVTVNPGIPVSTPAGAGSTAGPGTGRLS